MGLIRRKQLANDDVGLRRRPPSSKGLALAGVLLAVLFLCLLLVTPLLMVFAGLDNPCPIHPPDPCVAPARVDWEFYLPLGGAALAALLGPAVAGVVKWRSDTPGAGGLYGLLVAVQIMVASCIGSLILMSVDAHPGWVPVLLGVAALPTIVGVTVFVRGAGSCLYGDTT